MTERKEQLCVRKAVLRVQNALPTAVILTSNLTAKDAIDNGGAGRAAKGANPLLCAKNMETSFLVFIFFLPNFEGGL